MQFRDVLFLIRIVWSSEMEICKIPLRRAVGRYLHDDSQSTASHDGIGRCGQYKRP
jgi:hypothetical protein